MQELAAQKFQNFLENQLGLILTLDEVKSIEDYFLLAIYLAKGKTIEWLWELESNVEVYGETLAEAITTGGESTVLNRFTGKWRLKE